jgi:hypothetical protein
MTITIPSTVVTGDVLFVAVTSRDHASGTALPTCTDDDTGGNTWTLMGNSTDRKALWFWKRATSATASKTITVSGAVGSVSGGVTCFTGALGASTPYTDFVFETNASGDETTTAFTPTNEGSMVVHGVHNYGNDNAVTSVSGATIGAFTNAFEKLSTGGSDCATNVGYKLQAAGSAPSTTGAITWAQTDGTTYSARFSIVPDTSPAVVLNSPAASATVSDTTPDLDFTGTDVNGDTLQYQVQVDTVNTFDSTAGSTIDSFTGSATNSHSIGPAQAFNGAAETLIGDGKAIASVQFKLQGSGSQSGSAFATIYAVSGTPGTTAIPTGSALATSDAVNTTSIPSTAGGTDTPFTFSGANQITLTNGTNYFVAVEFTSGSSFLSVYRGTGDASDNAAAKAVSGGAWSVITPSSGDFYYILTSVALPAINAISSVSSTGFANTVTPGDTAPYNSGEMMRYTVQSALSNGVKYWRVRAIDPSGSNTYGAWATTRSFTVSSGGGTPNFLSLGGSLTPAGALIKAATVRKTGTVGSSAIIVKSATRSLTGGLTPAGVPRKVATRSLTASITPSGTALNTFLKSATGTLTPVGTLIKAITRSLLSGITPTGTITKSTSRTLGGSLTPSGAITALKATLVALSGTITPAGNIVKAVTRSLAGSLTPSGVIAKAQTLFRTLTASITPSGTIAKSGTRSLTGSVTPSGTVRKDFTRRLLGGITPTGIITTVRTFVRSLTGTIVPTGNVIKAITRSVTGGITPSGAITALKARFITLTASITPSGTLTKAVTRTLSAGITPVGTIAKAITRRVLGGITPTGAITALKARFITLTATITPSGTVVKVVTRSLIGTITPAAAIVKAVTRRVTGTITPTSTIQTLRVTLRSLSSSIASAGTIVKSVSRSLTGAITQSGTATRNITTTKGGTIVLSGTTGNVFTKALGGTIGLAGGLYRGFTKIVNGVITLVGTVILPPSGPSIKTDWTVTHARVNTFTAVNTRAYTFTATTARVSTWTAETSTI